jgi:hypothetical protein
MVDTILAFATTAYGTTVLTSPAFTSPAQHNMMMVMMGIVAPQHASISGATFAPAFRKSVC